MLLSLPHMSQLFSRILYVVCVGTGQHHQEQKCFVRGTNGLKMYLLLILFMALAVFGHRCGAVGAVFPKRSH